MLFEIPTPPVITSDPVLVDVDEILEVRLIVGAVKILVRNFNPELEFILVVPLPYNILPTVKLV